MYGPTFHLMVVAAPVAPVIVGVLLRLTIPMTTSRNSVCAMAILLLNHDPENWRESRDGLNHVSGIKLTLGLSAGIDGIDLGHFDRWRLERAIRNFMRQDRERRSAEETLRIGAQTADYLRGVSEPEKRALTQSQWRERQCLEAEKNLGNRGGGQSKDKIL